MDAEDDIALTDLLLMVAGTPVDGSELDRAGLQHEIGVILTKVHNGPTDAAIFGEVLGVLQHHQLALPPALVLVFRTIASLEGTVRRLVPGYDMVEQALSRTTHFASLTFSPKELFADARVQRRDHVRLPLPLEAEVADEGGVEDRVDHDAIVEGALVHPADAGALGRSRGAAGRQCAGE